MNRLRTNEYSQGHVLAQKLEEAGVGHGMQARGVQTTDVRVDEEGVLYFCNIPGVKVASVSGTPDGKRMPYEVKLGQRMQAPAPGYYPATFDVTQINGAIRVENLVLEAQGVPA